MTNVTFDPVAFLALGIAFLALISSIVNRRRIERDVRERVLAELGDPTSYTVVNDGKFYRVRGPFDTFYTIKFRDKKDAGEYAKQLAHYNSSVFNEQNWRVAA